MNRSPLQPEEVSLPEPPTELRRRFDSLHGQALQISRQIEQDQEELREIKAFLDLQPKVAERIEELSRDLFGNILDELERNLSFALQEVLGQDLKVTSNREISRGKMNITFAVERDGREEDILRGQGGSVCNILSVGLRLIALSQLEESRHRRFLILDEQDCWLRPDLVPRLMAIIHTIAHKLRFQVLVISHHNVELFRDHADRIYRLRPAPAAADGVLLEVLHQPRKAYEKDPDLD